MPSYSEVPYSNPQNLVYVHASYWRPYSRFQTHSSAQQSCAEGSFKASDDLRPSSTKWKNEQSQVVHGRILQALTHTPTHNTMLLNYTATKPIESDIFEWMKIYYILVYHSKCVRVRQTPSLLWFVRHWRGYYIRVCRGQAMVERKDRKPREREFVMKSGSTHTVSQMIFVQWT